MSKLPIALQLYTLRDQTAQDFSGTIRKVADMGYAAVELAGHGDLSIRELVSLLQDNHLRVAGSHVGIETMEQDIAKVIDENLALGNRYVVVPYLSEDRRQGADGYKRTAETLNGLGETLRSNALSLCYHNHDFEFQKQDNGELGIDILLQNTDPALVKAEVDTYWVLVGGQDPVEFVQKYRGRVPLMHLKDRDKTDGSFAPVGTGNLPLDALVAIAPTVGTEFLIVEQDVCKIPPLEAVKISYDNLKARGYA